MEDFEQVTEEEQWLEVRQKKTTPNKKPSASKSDNGRREKRGDSSKRPNNATDTKRDGKKRDEAKTKGAAGPAPKATVSTPVATPQKAALSAPPKTPSSAAATEGSAAPLGLQNEETAAPAAPTVTDSGVKRGYSSIVSALAAKLPPELPPMATVLDDAPLSIFEFCMRCQDASTLGTPVACPLVTRGLVNPKSDCFQNCVLQALFALPHFRRLLYSFRDCRRLDEHLPLWSEMLRFAGQFLVNPVELDNPSLSEASSGGKARRGASVASSARYKDCVLASEAMPQLCASFDTLVHREGHRVSDEGGDGPTLSTGGTLRLAEAFDQLQLSSTDDAAAATTATAAKPPLSLAETLKQSTNASSSSVAPATRRTKAASAAGSNNSQQDAMEFLTFVLDALHEELNCAAAALLTPDERSLLTAVIQSLPTYQRTSEQLAQATMTAAGATDEWATVRRSQPPAVKQVTVDAASKAQALRDLFAPSIIPRLCHGLLRSEVVYKTKKMCSITFQKFHCLTLNLRAPSPGSGRVTVRDALVNYFAEESLDSESLRKQSRFEVLPETLILHIGRFAFDYRLNQPVKMHTAVDYAHVLSIPRECLSGALSPPEGAHGEADEAATLPRYRLHAVVLHHGKKATGGHYSTLVRASVDDAPLTAEEDTTARWRSVDDHKIVQISADQALDAAERVYLLFYVRIH